MAWMVVSSVASNQFFLAVNPELPVKTLPEFIEYAYTGHGLVLDEQRQDFYARLLAFLEQHIGRTAAGADATAGGP